MVWHRATPFLNADSSSHRCFATARSLIYATMAGPPKAVAPRRRKARNKKGNAGLLTYA
jgi:hypothetical protein